VHGLSTTGRVRLSNAGSQPTIEYLPMGTLEIAERSAAWQIEQNGAWQWELGDHRRGLYLSLAGATEAQSAEVELVPGAATSTPQAALALGLRGTEALFGDLTRGRLVQRHPLPEGSPVVFNDYMNCLMADPTDAKLRPVIELAGRVGAEIFCVDAGWYSDAADWGDLVGDWRESRARFPHGLAAICDSIREAGMRPGLWLEPEVIGIGADFGDLTDADLFVRGGERTNGGGGRYQLDFGSSAVVARLDAAVDRLVADYGLGYFKLDYNINVGRGGDGGLGTRLERHSRAYLAWVDGIYARHPGIVIENCSSGGARADGASMAVFSTMSASDQNDALLSAPIAANVSTAATPEQCGVWVYPSGEMSPEHTAFAIVNGMLTAPQVSGPIWSLDRAQLDLLAAGVQRYRAVRGELASGVPVWPTNLATWDADWITQGVRTDDALHMAIWRRGGADTLEIDLAEFAPEHAEVDAVFPGIEHDFATDLDWDADRRVLRLTLDATPAARVLTLRRPDGTR
jgi:alpha-galactosidase